MSKATTTLKEHDHHQDAIGLDHKSNDGHVKRSAKVLTLDDYLDLTPSAARYQWSAVSTRAQLGLQRQPDFSPIETLLCFGLGLVAPPSASGRVNIRESDSIVVTLARLVKRTPASLAAKLANLDGRRPNGAKYEPALWVALTNNFLQFEALYEIVIEAGRSVGLGEEMLPDFLGAYDFTFRAVLEADKTTTDELHSLVESDLRDWAKANPSGNVSFTERAMLGMARVGQKQFARRVLRNANYACAFCGLSLQRHGLPSSRMLVASHIKPWRHSNNSERVDMDNGLAACPTHDAAFDGLLLSVDLNFNIVLGEGLATAMKNDPIIARNFGPASINPQLLFPLGSVAPGSDYLEWHRQLVRDSNPIGESR